MPPAPRTLGHQPALDGLRALAVTSVIGLHLGFFAGGNGGVTLFFALSGFLITALLLEEFDQTGRIGLVNFYARRALRLYPALCAMLAMDVAFVLLDKTGWEFKAGLAGAAAAFIYVTNWLSALHLLPLYQILHTWSLAVEEQFYLLWPALLLAGLGLRLTRPRLGLLIAIAAAGFTVERSLLAWAGASEMRIYTALDTRADALLMGAASAFVYRYRLLPRAPWNGSIGVAVAWLAFIALAAHLLGGIGAVPRSTAFDSIASYGGVAFVTCILILALVSSPRGALSSLLQWKPLRYVGSISYGLYLYHYLLFSIIDAQHFTWSRDTDIAVKLLVTAAVSIASYHLLERPFLRLKERFARPPHSNIHLLVRDRVAS